MYENEIQQMKKAAEQQDWEPFQQALRSLVCKIRREALGKLLLSYVQVFMNEFLSINPQHKLRHDELTKPDYDKILLEYLESITGVLEQHKGEPGVNNFRSAISKLQLLFQLDHCDEIYRETFVTSTINLLIAIPHQTWGKDHPDLYAQWLQGTSNEDLSILAIHEARNPKQTHSKKLLWLKFADDIDVLIQPDRT